MKTFKQAFEHKLPEFSEKKDIEEILVFETSARVLFEFEDNKYVIDYRYKEEEYQIYMIGDNNLEFFPIKDIFEFGRIIQSVQGYFSYSLLYYNIVNGIDED